MARVERVLDVTRAFSRAGSLARYCFAGVRIIAGIGASAKRWSLAKTATTSAASGKGEVAGARRAAIHVEFKSRLAFEVRPTRA